MKIALLYSLLIYQLLQHCDATGNGAGCRPLSEVRAGVMTTTMQVNPGSKIEIYSRKNHCNHHSNNNYTLLHQNHRTRELEVVSQQKDRNFTLSNVQLNTSGIYCTYKQCAPENKEWCCIRITVPPQMQMKFPDSVHANTQQFGACYVKAWPMLTSDDIDVFTDNGCAITKYPVNNESAYTTATLFTLDNINSSCQHVSCLTQFKAETRHINIIVAPTSVSESIPTSSCTPPSGLSNVPDDTGGGVLGIYRITLWIIVLTLTVLSTAMTSLTPSFT